MKYDIKLLNGDNDLKQMFSIISAKKNYKVKEIWKVKTSSNTSTNISFKSPKCNGDIHICHRKGNKLDTYTINLCNCIKRTHYFCKDTNLEVAMLTLSRL